ncbi:unnamed protein product [Paramecium sonneborni]|uniref:Uncharacterized protein n=1 Tax=Paramecium sonneborni TaxID=65129 RepID=A0A8S1MAB6_9CILI|nr:unnamed protein product [Paramecium sonneborni]
MNQYKHLEIMIIQSDKGCQNWIIYGHTNDVQSACFSLSIMRCQNWVIKSQIGLSERFCLVDMLRAKWNYLSFGCFVNQLDYVILRQDNKKINQMSYWHINKGCFYSDGNTLAAGDNNNSINLWDFIIRQQKQLEGQIDYKFYGIKYNEWDIKIKKLLQFSLYYTYKTQYKNNRILQFFLTRL